MKIRTEFTKAERKKYPELDNEDNMFVLKYILRRIKEGKNSIILTVGVTGSGKSWVNLRMAEILMVMQGKIFDTVNRIFFTLKTLLAYTNKQDIELGDVSVSEELGVSMGSRQWQKNVDYSQLLQTFRDLGLISFLNVPFKVMVDKHARLLAHFQIVMQMRENGMNVIKFFLLQHNPSAATESKTTYTKYLRVKKTNEWGFKKVKPIKKLYWEKPSQEVLDIYLPMQSAFKSGVRKRLEQKTNKEEEKDKEQTRTSKVTDEDIQRLMKKGLEKWEIANVLGVGVRTIQQHIKDMNETKENEKNTRY